jgi:hypothetical protein
MAGWFLQFQGSKFGPLSMDEVKVVLGSGKLSGPLYAWKAGMQDWEPVDRLPDLAKFCTAPKRDSDTSEQRRAKRVPFVATVKFAGAGAGANLALFTGICKDLSGSGMSVMSSNNPGFPGSLVTLTIEPVSDASLPRFSIEGVIVRLLARDSGFSVRFTKVTKQQEDAIAICLRAAAGGTNTASRRKKTGTTRA